jgi:4-hydroxy-tetrahydrodipicolinate reductase
MQLTHAAPIRICLAGATGRLGREVLLAAEARSDVAIVSAVAPRSEGRKLSEVVRESRADLVLSASVSSALEQPADVLIDYTKPSAAMSNVLTAIDRGVHVVIGTTGLSPADCSLIDESARAAKVGAAIAENFSLTFALLQRCASMIAAHLPDWAIVDVASPGTRAPLETTRGLARRLAGSALSEAERDRRVHSIRVPGRLSGVELVFGRRGEQLVLSHTAESFAPHAAGTLLAALAVSSWVGLVRGLDSILEYGHDATRK